MSDYTRKNERRKRHREERRRLKAIGTRRHVSNTAAVGAMHAMHQAAQRVSGDE